MKYGKLTKEKLNEIIDETASTDTVHFDFKKRLKEIISSSREGLFEVNNGFMVMYLSKSSAKHLLKQLYE